MLPQKVHKCFFISSHKSNVLEFKAECFSIFFQLDILIYYKDGDIIFLEFFIRGGSYEASF